MDNPPASSLLVDEPKPVVVDAPVVAAAVIDHNMQSTAANNSLKDLSLNSFSEVQTLSVPAADHPAPTNGTNGTKRVSPSTVNGEVTNAQLPSPAPELASTDEPVEDVDTVMTVEYIEHAPTAGADPAVQQPVSDLRSVTDPLESAAIISEIKEQKLQSDLSSDRVLAEGMAEGNDAPIARSITPPAAAPANHDAMEFSATIEPPASDVNLPHHPPAASTTEGPAPETSLDLAPTPATEQPKPSSEEPSLLAPPQPSQIQQQDSPMTDAPPSPGKLARSREETEEDEPATKRLKAGGDGASQPPEFKVPDPPSVPAETQTSETAAPAARVKNPDHEKPMTGPQKKLLGNKIFSILKRGNYSNFFRAPVDFVALNIPTYPDVVKEPMDLGTMEKKVKEDQYGSVAEVCYDFDLIVNNCLKFNGPEHAVSKQVLLLQAAIDKQVSQMPSSDFTEEVASQKKAKRPSIEKPAPRARRESTNRVPTGTAKSPVAASPTQAFALGPQGVPTIRRDSTATNDRPKREIHPPAPKDLPYSTQKPKKKKFVWELRWCQDTVNDLKKPKYGASNWPFLQPVDPVALNIPTYLKIIKKPIDISTIDAKLKAGEYENAKEFDADFRLMLANAFKFNLPDEGVYKAGKQLEAIYNEKWDGRQQWISDHAPAATQSPESSPEASDESEEEDDDEDEETDTRSAQIEAMQRQIELMNQQMQLLQGAPPKKKTPPASTKKAKKGSKPPKKEAGSKKKMAGGQKKEGKAKKAAKTPYVTYEEKQDISNRINELPEARMSTALTIIRDNMPNLKGVQEDEIELDIDELSNEVLYKLLTFVRKYAPLPTDDIAPLRAAPVAATSSRPKKNKPMGKVEQEARIKELQAKLKGEDGSEEGGLAGVGGEESSGDDEDSEESEED